MVAVPLGPSSAAGDRNRHAATVTKEFQNVVSHERRGDQVDWRRSKQAGVKYRASELYAPREPALEPEKRGLHRIPFRPVPAVRANDLNVVRVQGAASVP